MKQHSVKQKKISSLSLASQSSPVQESDFSSDEPLVPSLSMLKSRKDIQQQVDSRLREMEESSFAQSSLAHDSILGGTS